MDCPWHLTATVTSLDLAGHRVHSAEDGAVLFYLGGSITIEVVELMVELDPSQIVILDGAFGGNDELKVNAMQTVRRRAQLRESEMSLKVV